jgi:hypothetical protein
LTTYYSPAGRTATASTIIGGNSTSISRGGLRFTREITRLFLALEQPSTMLGGFNFLENIREENDDELLEEEAACDRNDVLQDQHTSLHGVIQRDYHRMHSNQSSDACEISFESTDHTRSLSDTSSHDDGTPRRSRHLNQVANITEGRQAQLRSISASATTSNLSSPSTVQKRNGDLFIASKTRFLERIGGSRYQEVPEDASAQDIKRFNVIRTKIPPNESRKHSLSNLLQSWMSAITTKTRKAVSERRVERTRSDGSLISTTSRGKQRKAPSGSFASAIGRDDYP